MHPHIRAAAEHFAIPGREGDATVLWLALKGLIEVIEAGQAGATATTLNLRRAVMIPMQTGQQDELKINPLGAKGEPEPVTGITWSSSDTAVVTVAPAPGGLSCLAVSAGPGAATVTVKATNSAGVELTASQDYEVTEPATGLNLTAGAPTAVPPAAPPAPAPGA